MAHLVEIMNLYFETGDFPEELKEVVVIPHLKKLTLNPMDTEL